MKTLQQILSDYKSETLDHRDSSRLMDFIPEKDLKTLGIELKDEYIGKHKPILLTKRNILRRLKQDIAFGFEKALNKRGLSAEAMWWVISMWNWILEEGLEDFSSDNYAQYGLPLLKATALKYGFDNPINDDVGDEYKYSADGDYPERKYEI